MPPLIFVATNRLKAGKLDAERERVPGLVEFLEREEPQLLAFHEFVDADSGEVTVVQVHPDAASFQKHLGVVRERAAEAYAQTLDRTVAVQAFGPLPDGVLEGLRAQTGDGVRLTLAGEHIGGFSRG